MDYKPIVLNCNRLVSFLILLLICFSCNRVNPNNGLDVDENYSIQLYKKALERITLSKSYSNLLNEETDSSYLINSKLCSFSLGVFSESDISGFCREINVPINTLMKLETDNYHDSSIAPLSELNTYNRSHKIITFSPIIDQFLFATVVNNDIMVDKKTLEKKVLIDGKEVGYFLFMFDKDKKINKVLEDMAFFEQY